jgi:hypothetical protein
MEIIKSNAIIKGVSKKYHLTFCNTHKYLEGSPYYNNKGESIPMYLSYGARIYKLKYIDGCFKPFLVDITAEIDKSIDAAYSQYFMSKNEEVKNKALKYVEYLESLFK